LYSKILRQLNTSIDHKQNMKTCFNGLVQKDEKIRQNSLEK